MTDARLVRDLLDANLALTKQFVELARIAIGAPVVEYVERAPMDVQVPQFQLDMADDWPDIPDDLPLGPQEAQVLHMFPRSDPREVKSDLPLHMTEEEEDLRFAVAHEQEPPAALKDFLKKLNAPSELDFDPLA